MKTMKAVLLFVAVACLFAACGRAAEDNQLSENPAWGADAFKGSVSISKVANENPAWGADAFRGGVSIVKVTKKQ